MTSWPEGVNPDDVEDIVSIVAGSLHRTYRQHSELDDIKQTLNEWCWRKREKVAEYLVRDDPKERKSGQAAMMRSLHREGARHCRREKAAKSGYEVSDEFFYSTALVEDVLKVIVNGGPALQGKQQEHGGKNMGDPAEGGNMVAVVADINREIERLDDDTRNLMVSLLGLGVPAEKLAEQRGVTPQAVRQKVQRACVRVVRELGGETPWR